MKLLVSCALLATAIHAFPLGAPVGNYPGALYAQPPSPYYAPAYGYGPARYAPLEYGYGSQEYPMYLDDRGFKKGGIFEKLGKALLGKKAFGAAKTLVRLGKRKLKKIKKYMDEDQEFKSGHFKPLEEESDLSNFEPAEASFPLTTKGEFLQEASVPAYKDGRGFKRGHFLDKLIQKFVGGFLGGMKDD
uniref:Uncharacterized protein n=1 Tax=Steinernema glaseri TaxID=37863 RepID=A0A1I7XW33_9BILA